MINGKITEANQRMIDIVEEKKQKIQDEKEDILQELKELRKTTGHLKKDVPRKIVGFLKEKEVSKKNDEEKYIESIIEESKGKIRDYYEDYELAYKYSKFNSEEIGKVIVDLMTIFENKSYQYKIEEYDIYLKNYSMDMPASSGEKFQIFLNNQGRRFDVVSFPIDNTFPISFIEDYEDKELCKEDMNIREFLSKFHYIKEFIYRVINYRYAKTKKEQNSEPAPITSNELELLEQHFLKEKANRIKEIYGIFDQEEEERKKQRQQRVVKILNYIN